MKNKTGKADSRKSRSKILWQITALVLSVFLITVTAIALVYNTSTHELIEKSKNDLIETQVKTASSAFRSLSDILNTLITERFGSGDTAAEFANGIISKKENKATVEANAILKNIAKQGLVGDGYLVVVLPKFPPLIKEPTVFVSNEDDLMFESVPESVYSILESGKQYGLIEAGLPEWGLKGEQLVIYRKMKTNYAGGVTVYAVGIKPVQGDIDRVYKTYDQESNKINLLIAVVSACSLLFLFVITFFVLRHLINSRITKPIDELSEAAEQVMEGDLDIEVPVKEGEEFESLKKVFNEMIKSFRSLISRSTGE